jgi:hypothetical protein
VRGVPLLGGGATALYLRDAGGNASSLTVWLNGAELGGCAGARRCARPMVLPLPNRSAQSGAAADVLVLAVVARPFTGLVLSFRGHAV